MFLEVFREKKRGEDEVYNQDLHPEKKRPLVQTWLLYAPIYYVQKSTKRK